MFDVAKINKNISPNRYSVTCLFNREHTLTTDVFGNINTLFVSSGTICLLHKVVATLDVVNATDQRVQVRFYHEKDTPTATYHMFFNSHGNSDHNFNPPIFLRSGIWTIQGFQKTGANAVISVELYGNIVSL